LSTTLPLTLAIAGVVGVAAMVLPMEAVDRTSAFIAVLAAACLGSVALVLKTQLGALNLQGTAALKALMVAQGLSFFLRLIVVGVGAFALKAEYSPMAYVIAFFAVSLPQQALETKALLRGTIQMKSSEVTS
ncbi:MAG TPA: hypothetical protein VGE37_14465, partial [Archangium sp.]